MGGHAVEQDPAPRLDCHERLVDSPQRLAAKAIARRPDVDGELDDPGDDVDRPRHGPEHADRADRPGNAAADPLDGEHRLGCGGKGVMAKVHGHGPGVAGPPHHLDPATGSARDGGHHPDGKILRLEHRPLLDVHLDVSGDVIPMVLGIADRIRVEPEGAQRLAEPHPVVVHGGEKTVVEGPRDGPAADEGGLEPETLLVSERDDVDRIVEPLPALVQRLEAGDGQHDAERAVVLPGVSHRIEMGTEDEPAHARPPAGEAADHVAHRVEPCAHARLAHPPHDDLGRLGVLRGEVAARELDRVLAALRKLV